MVYVLVINRCRTNRLALREVKQMYFKCDFWGEGLGGGLATGSGSGLPQGCPGSTAASPEGLTQGTYFQGGSSVSATVGWDPAPPTWACLQAAEHPDDVVAASPVPGMREQSGRGGCCACGPASGVAPCLPEHMPMLPRLAPSGWAWMPDGGCKASWQAGWAFVRCLSKNTAISSILTIPGQPRHAARGLRRGLCPSPWSSL